MRNSAIFDILNQEFTFKLLVSHILNDLSMPDVKKVPESKGYHWMQLFKRKSS